MEQARDLARLHADLFDAETRGLHGALTLAVMMAFVGASLFPRALAVLAGVSVIGGLVLIRRAVRRHRDVRAFCRDARLVDASVIVPAARPDHTGGWYVDLAIPDAERAMVARVRRRWPRGSFVAESARVATWYAPGSSIVISFDRRGEPILGCIETRSLPRATIAQR